MHKLDKGEEFVIEKLYRGSIVNHNSFLMNDGIDTDAKCKTAVSFYYIDVTTIARLRAKHYELDESLTAKEMQLVNPNAKEPALDYIIKDQFARQQFFKHKKTKRLVHNYADEEMRNKLTVKLKNAIMVLWLEVKSRRTKKSMEEIIKDLMAKKKYQEQNAQAFKEERKRAHKEKKERAKQEALAKQKEAEAHLSSYINNDQFNHLYESVLDVNLKITQHSETIDEIEKKLLEVNQLRKKRREKQEMQLHEVRIERL